MYKQSWFIVPFVFLVGVLMVVGCQDEPVSTDQTGTEPTDQWQPTGTIVADRYIVVLKDLPALGKVDAAVASLAAAYSLDVDQVYSAALQGFAAKVPADKLDALRADAMVDYIEQDRVISLPPTELESEGLSKVSAETTPPGITRVHGGVSYTGKAVAWIIDTGVDFSHPDLTVDVSRSKNFINQRKTANDDNGHGSHVAGIISARDNDIGVIGVAAGATVVAVKVLNSAGSGTVSGVVAGVNYVAANGKSGDVANMSLGGGVSSTIDKAVKNAASTGVKFCLAAGNSSANANLSSPARVEGPNIYTISACDQNDVFAYFSNYGNPPIEYCEPGVSILSTYRSGKYATMSGTSMATPHASGILLLGSFKTDGSASGDPDGNPDPIGVH